MITFPIGVHGDAIKAKVFLGPEEYLPYAKAAMKAGYTPVAWDNFNTLGETAGVNMWVRESKDLSTIAHEAVHVTMNALECIGVKLLDQELIAYNVGLIVGRASKKRKRK